MHIRICVYNKYISLKILLWKVDFLKVTIKYKTRNKIKNVSLNIKYISIVDNFRMNNLAQNVYKYSNMSSFSPAIFQFNKAGGLKCDIIRRTK